MDARFFIKAGFPTVTYGPGPIGVAHAPDEYVEMRHVINVAKAYYDLKSTASPTPQIAPRQLLFHLAGIGPRGLAEVSALRD